MRKDSVTLTFDKFEGWLVRYVTLLNRIIAARRVVGTPVDKKEILEAFVFKIVSLWEVFVEDLMAAYLGLRTAIGAVASIGWGKGEAIGPRRPDHH